MVVLALSVYELDAARHELDVIIRVTVPGRVVVGVSIIVLVSLWGYWTAIVFGRLDIAAALWTRAALRRARSRRVPDRHRPATPPPPQGNPPFAHGS